LVLLIGQSVSSTTPHHRLRVTIAAPRFDLSHRNADCHHHNNHRPRHPHTPSHSRSRIRIDAVISGIQDCPFRHASNPLFVALQILSAVACSPQIQVLPEPLCQRTPLARPFLGSASSVDSRPAVQCKRLISEASVYGHLLYAPDTLILEATALSFFLFF